MDNTRKQIMITKVCNEISPIYQFLAINNDKKNLAIIDNAIRVESVKADNTTDDKFFDKIIYNLKDLSLPNDYKLCMYKYMTLSELRDKIVDRLTEIKKFGHLCNRKKHWYEKTEE